MTEKFRRKTHRDAPQFSTYLERLAWSIGYNKALDEFDERFKEELSRQ